MKHLLCFLTLQVSITIHAFGEDQWRIALDSALALHEYGQFAQAQEFGKRALGLAIAGYDTMNKNTAEAFHSLGIICNQGDTRGAADLYLSEALRIREQMLPVDHIDLGRTLTHLGRLRLGRNRDIALAMMKRALVIIESSPDARPEDLGFAQLHVGSGLLNVGQAPDALLHYEAALGAFRKSKHDHPLIADALINIGIARYSLNQTSASEPYFIHALAFCDSFPPKSYVTTGNVLMNYGTLLYHEQKLEEAARIMNRAVSLFEAARDTDYLAFSLSNLGSLYERLNDDKNSEMTLLRAAAMFENSLSNNRQGTQVIYSRLGWLYRKQQQWSKAYEFIQREVDIKAAEFGRHSLEARMVQSSLIQVLIAMNRERDAWLLYDTLLVARRMHLTQVISKLSESDALRFASGWSGTFYGALSTYFRLGDEKASFAMPMFNQVLWSKGAVTDQMIAQKQFALLAADTAFQERQERLTAIQSELSRSYVLHDDGTGARGRTLDSLNNLCRKLETAIRRSIPAMANPILTENLVERLQHTLPANSALVEFVEYLRGTEVDSNVVAPHYAAVVLTRSTPPQLFELGQSKAIHEAIEAYRRALPSTSATSPRRLGSDIILFRRAAHLLYSLIWKPFAELIRPGTTVYIAPDEALTLVSFSTLVNDKGGFLIEEVSLHYLSCGRDLLRENVTDKQRSGLIAFGDPDFNASPRERSLDIATISSKSIDSSSLHAMRNVRAKCVGMNEMKVDGLPHTGYEAKNIAATWKSEFTNEVVMTYLGAMASEEMLKRNAPGKQIIHIATHGYHVEASFLGRDSLRPSLNDVNPLLLSGLLLAGANLRGKDADTANAEDGILTALEVSAMDLRGTDLVVLSACETGLGKVEQGEGVYGLRRAFQMAGAKTVVSSLWRVPDDETMKFMKTLYSTKAKTYPELMQQVALQRIREARLRCRPTHPFTWGAFVATGDWRIR